MKSLNVGKIFSLNNRGILLDLCAFVLNVFLLRLLTGNFIELTRAPNEEVPAKIAVALFYIGLLILAPLGAILKRHRFWERVNAQNKKARVSRNINSIIFAPTFCFIQLMFIYALVVVSWHRVFLPDSYLSSTTAIFAIFFGGFIYCFVGALAVSKFYEDEYDKPFWNFRGREYIDDFVDFFDKPIFERFWNFLETPRAAALGDLCIFLNMICFQIFWGYLFSDLYSEGVKTVGDVFFASILYLLLACLFYFPPRNFYLAEDLHRPIIWLTIFLANTPSFLYFFFRIHIF